jgi:hypothetical protein
MKRKQIKSANKNAEYDKLPNEARENRKDFFKAVIVDEFKANYRT